MRRGRERKSRGDFHCAPRIGLPQFVNRAIGTATWDRRVFVRRTCRSVGRAGRGGPEHRWTAGTVVAPGVPCGQPPPSTPSTRHGSRAPAKPTQAWLSVRAADGGLVLPDPVKSSFVAVGYSGTMGSSAGPAIHEAAATPGSPGPGGSAADVGFIFRSCLACPVPATPARPRIPVCRRHSTAEDWAPL